MHFGSWGQGLAPEGHPTPNTRLFWQNSGVHLISNTRDFAMMGVHLTPDTRPFARVSGRCENWGQKPKKWAHLHQTSPKGKSSTNIRCPMTTMKIRISVDSFRRINAFSKKITSASVTVHARAKFTGSQPEKEHIRGNLQGNRLSPDR
jgi:hypothetical protein